MNAQYNLFTTLNDGTVVWLEVVSGLEMMRARLTQLANTVGSDFVAMDEVVARAYPHRFELLKQNRTARC